MRLPEKSRPSGRLFRLHHQAANVRQHVVDDGDKARTIRTVNYTVVEGERNRHHQTRHKLFTVPHWLHRGLGDTEDSHFRRVHNRREVGSTQATDAGDGEATALHFASSQLAITRFLGDHGQFTRQLGNALLVHVFEDRNNQTIRSINRYTDVDVFLQGQALTVFRQGAVAAHHLINQKPYWLVLRQKLLLSLPVIGPMVRGQKLTQIFTVLALTQNAGIPFLQGLESVTETLANPFWSQRLALVQHDISAGKPVWLALKNSGEFSPLCIQLVRTGEASGSLDAMLRNLAHHHGEKTLAQAENLAALLEPALLVITGLIIGTLVVAMYLPIFHLGDAMSGVG